MRRVNEVAFGNTKTIGGKNQVRQLDNLEQVNLKPLVLKFPHETQTQFSNTSFNQYMDEVDILEPTIGQTPSAPQSEIIDIGSDHNLFSNWSSRNE